MTLNEILESGLRVDVIQDSRGFGGRMDITCMWEEHKFGGQSGIMWTECVLQIHVEIRTPNVNS